MLSHFGFKYCSVHCRNGVVDTFEPGHFGSAKTALLFKHEISIGTYTIHCVGQGISLKSERNNHGLNHMYYDLTFLQTQSIVYATV